MNQHATKPRRVRHHRAYRLGLQERLTETHHQLSKTTQQLIQNPTDQRLKAKATRALRRTRRLQALLNATDQKA